MVGYVGVYIYMCVWVCVYLFIVACNIRKRKVYHLKNSYSSNCIMLKEAKMKKIAYINLLIWFRFHY